MNAKVPPTYEDEVLSVLAFEFSTSQHAESERKIRRRFATRNLAPTIKAESMRSEPSRTMSNWNLETSESPSFMSRRFGRSLSYMTGFLIN